MLDVSVFYHLETLSCISSLEMYLKCSNVATEHGPEIRLRNPIYDKTYTEILHIG